MEVDDKLKPHFDNFSSNIQEHCSRSQRYFQFDEPVSRRRGLEVSTSEKANLKLQVTVWITFHPSAVVLSGFETRFHKKNLFLEYNPNKSFNIFVQSTVDIRRQIDENPNSSVVAETTKLLANSSYGYLIKNRSRHTITKYLNNEKTRCATKSKFFKKLNHTKHRLYDVEFAKSRNWTQRNWFCRIFFCFNLQRITKDVGARLHFVDKSGDIDELEEYETDTGTLPFARAEKELIDCIRPEMRAEWEYLGSGDCDDSFTADAWGLFPLELVAPNKRSKTIESRVSSKKNSGAWNCCVFVVKLIAATKLSVIGQSSAARVSKSPH